MDKLEQLLQEQSFLDSILNYEIKIIDKETRFWMIRTKKGYFYNEFISNSFIGIQLHPLLIFPRNRRTF